MVCMIIELWFAFNHLHTCTRMPTPCVCSVRVWAFVCVLAKCEMLVSFALFPYTGHSGTSRTQPMHKLYEQSFSPFKAGGRTQSEATNMSRSDVTCYAILDNNFFLLILTSSFGSQYWRHYQAAIKKFRWYNGNSSCDQSFRHVYYTQCKSFSQAVYKVLLLIFFFAFAHDYYTNTRELIINWFNWFCCIRRLLYMKAS